MSFSGKVLQWNMKQNTSWEKLSSYRGRNPVVNDNS